MNIYLAATYGQMLEMRDVAAVLRAAGHTVTARWIDGVEEDMSKQQAALMDLADIDFADVVISYSLAEKHMHIGGGRHFEFGYAYATQKRNIIVGPKGEHIFHWLPSIEHFPTLEEAMKAL
jgi:nucleoside 2-deoxyribosyltransferase